MTKCLSKVSDKPLVIFFIYRVRPDSKTMWEASPFNIAEPLTLYKFTRDEIDILYGQHTEATAQILGPNSID
jgi:hypothetical protein